MSVWLFPFFAITSEQLIDVSTMLADGRYSFPVKQITWKNCQLLWKKGRKPIPWP